MAAPAKTAWTARPGYEDGDEDTVLFQGSSTAGWMWINHEYVSYSSSPGHPTLTSAPNGQHLTLAKWLKIKGVLTNDIYSDTWAQADLDTYLNGG